jgi:anthranilate phosphoribosyltransferase
MQDLITQLASGKSLEPDQIEQAVAFLTSESGEAEQKAAFLLALRNKGETAAEIAGFAQALLGRAVNPEIDLTRLSGPVLDVCGTGGDRSDLFNVSTTSMFLLAAGGAVIVKHGNRGITSQCGGADVLEELGVRIDLSPAALRQCVEKTGIGFIFAPNYHPAFKSIAPVRKMLAAQGIPTVFNLLGPLLNPARPSRQLIGIFSQELLPKIAQALVVLGRKRAWVVHGRTPSGGVDEISTMGSTHVLNVADGEIEPFQLTPEEFGIERTQIQELRGGTRVENAAILTGILDGSIRGPKRDVVVLNAAAGFVVAGLSKEIADGILRAEEQIHSGAALAKLKALQACSAT